jgi:hypothetical protein
MRKSNSILRRKLENKADASLLELAKAFKVLKKAELGLRGEPFWITGLLGYLPVIEKED